jgi:hypothetical protein
MGSMAETGERRRGGPRRSGRGWAIAALSAVLILLPAIPAQASTWSVFKLPDPGIQASLYGVSCSSPTLCVGVGANSTIATSRNPTGGPRAWTVFQPGGGAVVPDFPGGGDPIFAGAQIRGVSCPTDGFCAAASFDGRIFTSTDPATGPATWQVTPMQDEKKPRVHMGGISCPTPSFCVAAAYAGKVAFSTNPTGGRPAWSVVELSQPFDLRGISCPSPSLCLAVGNEGNIVASTNPTGGPTAWNPVGAPLGAQSINGIDCPSPSLCVTGNAAGVAVSDNPAGGAWRVVSAGTGLPIKSTSCPSTGACAAVDNNSDVLASTDPTNGASWWFKNVLPFGSGFEDGPEGPGQGNGTFGISCPTMTLCVAIGQDSQVLTSTDPFVRDPVVGAKKRKSKLPRVRITSHPPKRMDHRKGGAKAVFAFRAIGRAARFLCKIDDRRWRRCRPPKRYRVGAGKHAFRVRAVARGGARGPKTSFHFRVGRLIEPPPVGSCRGDSGSPGAPCIPAG